MKICVHYTLSNSYLEKADEIKISLRRIDEVPSIAEKYPNAAILIDNPKDEPIDWEQFRIYSKLVKKGLYLIVPNFKSAKEAKAHNAKFYFGYSLKTPYEVNAAIALGVSYIKLAAPAFFYLQDLPKEVPYRVAANVAYSDGFERENGIDGSWILPRDLPLYEPYLSTIEFDGVNTTQEETLFRIYSGETNYTSDFSLLIKNGNIDKLVPVRLIDPEISKRRLGCQQKCAIGKCKYCFNAFTLASILAEKGEIEWEKNLKPS